MDRRQFLQSSLGAAFVAPARGRAVERAGAGTAHRRPAPVPRKLVLDVYSKSLHWLRSADEVAQAAIEMVCGGVCPTVQPYPGHIDPARVAQELPAFVKRVRSHGLRVTQIKGPAITRRHRAERRSDHRRGGAGRLHALLARRLHLRPHEAARAAARCDQGCASNDSSA